MLKKFACCVLILAIMTCGLGFAESSMTGAYEAIVSIIRNVRRGNQEIKPEPLYEKYDIEIQEEKGPFKDDSALVQSLRMTIDDASDHFDYVAQNHNPEPTYDSTTHELLANIYLTLNAQCDKKEAKEIVEEYTDVLIEVLIATYPNMDIQSLYICWEIPSVLKNSLYAATFLCKKEDGVVTRGKGSGAIY